jgi:hypothetical protein
MKGLDAKPTRRWNRMDLERRLCRALEFAERAVERLAADGYTDAQEPTNKLRPEKVISETAFLLYAASRARASREVRVRIERVAERLLPHARSERMRLGVCLEPALAWDYAQAHVCLGRLGHQDRAFDALLRRSLRAQARRGRERPPHRVLEQEWIARTWKASDTAHGERTSRAALGSALGRPMDLLSGSREDVYAFTHALMYVTDFSQRLPILPRRRDIILAEAEAALARCLDEEDYDLGGEVLLAWPLTGKGWSAAAAFGFTVLARVEDEAGFLPSQGTRLDRLAALDGAERADYLLATAYHTAYVMGLLCAAALQPGRTPPSEIHENGNARGSASAIMEFIARDDRRPHWCDDFDRLSGRRRDMLAGLLLNIALRRKVGQRDFHAVHELLERGYAWGWLTPRRRARPQSCWNGSPSSRTLPTTARLPRPRAIQPTSWTGRGSRSRFPFYARRFHAAAFPQVHGIRHRAGLARGLPRDRRQHRRGSRIARRCHVLRHTPQERAPRDHRRRSQRAGVLHRRQLQCRVEG